MIDIKTIAFQAAQTLQDQSTPGIVPLPALEGIKFFNQFIAPIIAVIAVGIGLFILLKIRSNYADYAGSGRRLGRFWIFIQKGQRFACNINEVETPFSEDVFEILKTAKEEEKINEGVAELEKLVKQKRIFIYDVKITNRQYAFDLKTGTNKGLIISSAPLDDRSISWQDQYGYVTINSFPNKEFPYMVFCHLSSQFFEVKTPDDNMKPVWVISPIPMTEDGEIPFGFTVDDLRTTAHNLSINVLSNMKSLAEAVLHMKPLAKMFNVLETKNIEIRKLTERLEKKDLDIAELQLKLDTTNMELNQHPLEGELPKPPLPPKGPPYGWLVAAGFAGLVGYALPSYVPQLANFPPIFSGAIAVFVMIAVFYYTNKDTSKEVGKLETLREE